MGTESKTETRLEEHRREFTRNNGCGPMIRVEDLSTEEIALVNADFLELCRGRADDIKAIYGAYVQALHLWGVICPHPLAHRLYGGFQRSDSPLHFEDAKWYDCCICGTSVINR
jgi:hypothetical protein